MHGRYIFHELCGKLTSTEFVENVLSINSSILHYNAKNNFPEFHRIYGKQVSSQIKSSRSRWSYVIKSVKKSCVTLSAIIFALSGLGSLLGPGLDSTSPHCAKLAATTNCFATGLHIGMTEGGGGDCSVAIFKLSIWCLQSCWLLELELI